MWGYYVCVCGCVRGGAKGTRTHTHKPVRRKSQTRVADKSSLGGSLSLSLLEPPERPEPETLGVRSEREGGRGACRAGSVLCQLVARTV